MRDYPSLCKLLSPTCSFVRVESGGIVLKRFKIKFDRANNRIDMARGKIKKSFVCTHPYSKLEPLACIADFDVFNFDPKNGRCVLGNGFECN